MGNPGNSEKKMVRGRGILVGILVCLILVSIFVFTTSPKITGFATYQEGVNEEYLENIKLKANVECLQNSQCSEGFECINNNCVDRSSLNLCQEIELSTIMTKLKPGFPINFGKRVITDFQLPYLLNDGKIIEIVENDTIEHPYIQVILIGDSKIEMESSDYIIKSGLDSNLFTYRLSFLKSIDFSSKNIQGQVLRILGKEYVIGSASDNSVIELIFSNKKINLKNEKRVNNGLFSNGIDGTSVNVVRGDDGNVALIEIVFEIESNINDNKNNIKVRENYSDSVFNAVKLSFKDVEDKFVDVRIGSSC